MIATMELKTMIAGDASTSSTAASAPTTGRFTRRSSGGRRVDRLGAVCLTLAVVCALVALSAAAATVDEVDDALNGAALEKRARSFAFAKRARFAFAKRAGGEFGGGYGSGRSFAFAKRASDDMAPQKRFDYGDFDGGRSFAFAKRGGEFGGRSFAFA